MPKGEARVRARGRPSASEHHSFMFHVPCAGRPASFIIAAASTINRLTVSINPHFCFSQLIPLIRTRQICLRPLPRRSISSTGQSQSLRWCSSQPRIITPVRQREPRSEWSEYCSDRTMERMSECQTALLVRVFMLASQPASHSFELLPAARDTD